MKVDIRIPSIRFEEFKETIKKLNAKAVKYDCPMIEFIDSGIENVCVRKAYIDEWGWKVPAIYADVHNIHLQAGQIKMADWILKSRLDHTQNGITIVCNVPGETIPSKYFNANSWCDHCSSLRLRNDTFIVQNIKTGEFKQVGRQCLADFLGIDPVRKLKHFQEILTTIEEYKDDEDSWVGSSWFKPVFNIEDVLDVAQVVIQEFGYISRKMVEESIDHKIRTSETVLDVLWPSMGTKAQEFAADIRTGVTDKVKEETRKIIKWASKLNPEESEYNHNITQLIKSGKVTSRFMGYAVSIIPSYNRAMNAITEKKDKINEWVGGLGMNIQADVEVTAVTSKQGQYRTTIICFNDNEGRTYVWFASGSRDFQRGDKMKIYGTVKKHNEWNGIKQTVLTRVKILETYEQ